MTGSRVTARRQTWLAERRATAAAFVPALGAPVLELRAEFCPDFRSAAWHPPCR